jgi:hypothetical protein
LFCAAGKLIQRLSVELQKQLMKPYDIEVATGGLSITYQVYKEEDGKYLIKQDDDIVGKISGTVNEKGIHWETDEDIDNLLLEAIGNAIEAEEGLDSSN